MSTVKKTKTTYKRKTLKEKELSNKRKGNRLGKHHVLTTEDKTTLGLMYEEGVTVAELMDRFNISRTAVYYALGDEEVKKIREAYRRTAVDQLWRAFERNRAKVDDIIDKYMNEASLENRIKRTDLPGLFKVFNSIMANKIKLKELSLKEEEVLLKRKLVDANPEPDTGMIKDLLTVLDNQNGMKIHYTGSNEDKKEDDVDDDIKERSKVRKAKTKAEAKFKKYINSKKEG